MKKIILLILALICLSGCSANYDVVFSDKVTETLTIPSDEYNINALPSFIDEIGSSEKDEKIEGVNYYDVSDINGNRLYSYVFDFDDYTRSNITNTCMKSVKINKVDGVYMLNTSQNISCFKLYNKLENVNINLVFDRNYYEVITSNADYVNNYTLTWRVDRNNYQTKYIQVKFKKVDNSSQNDNEDEVKDETWIQKHSFLFTVIVVGLFLAGIGVIILLKIKKNTKTNRF